QVGVGRGGEVALAGGGDHHDDELAGVLGAVCDLHGGPGGGAGGDSRKHSLLTGEAAGHDHCVLILHLDDLVDHAGVQDRRNETGADSLNRVGTFRAAGEDGGGCRFYG